MFILLLAIPGTYQLGQNYPNMFNPTKIMKYQTPNLSNANFASSINYEPVEWDGEIFQAK